MTLSVTTILLREQFYTVYLYFGNFIKSSTICGYVLKIFVRVIDTVEFARRAKFNSVRLTKLLCLSKQILYCYCIVKLR